jgi:alkyldihydroxyacetonephosphate synthase
VAARDYPSGTFDAAPPADALIYEALLAEGLDVDASAPARAEHGRDWWPVSLLDVAAARVPAWPGVVVYAHREADVEATMRVATRHDRAVTVQGGRSSVVGGAQPRPGAIALDVTGLNEIGPIDAVSGLVEVGAGVFGPDLEDALREYGLTLGHFPQSYEISTVGGWLACRGAGQYSNRYGTAADLVRRLRVTLASGTSLDVGASAPRAALGPDLTQLFVGSEGTLGVITSATLVARPRAPYEQRLAYAVSSFAHGLEVCRRVLRRGASPAVLRLYDELEAQRLFDEPRAVLLVLDEGDERLVHATMDVVADEAAALEPLDVALVARWLEHRNDVSALADLWARGVVVDTIEVAAPWVALPVLGERVLAALRQLEGTVVASVHQSHAYLDGACLYFTFAGVGEQPVDYYRRAWDAAMGVVSEHGAISHHHGVGRNRARFVRDALGGSFDVLAALKGVLDPRGLLNPGVLALGGAPW